MIYIRQCSETRFPHLKINGKIYMLIEKKAKSLIERQGTIGIGVIQGLIL